jgi:hypothetical protein
VELEDEDVEAAGVSTLAVPRSIVPRKPPVTTSVPSGVVATPMAKSVSLPVNVFDHRGAPAADELATKASPPSLVRQVRSPNCIRCASHVWIPGRPDCRLAA